MSRTSAVSAPSDERPPIMTPRKPPFTCTRATTSPRCSDCGKSPIPGELRCYGCS